jgi:HAD superfamily hydrolase (TIGR01509 family)
MRERDLMKAPDLIVFDCDGVLVDSELLAMRAYKNILADFDVPQTLWSRCVGLKQADIFALIERSASRAIGPEIRDLLWPHTRELFGAELRPTLGLVEFLDRLDARRCVASSSHPERIRFSLDVTGLSRFFGDDVFSTQYVQHGKPAPDIFLYAAEKMRVAAENVLVIEDSEPGVLGARAAGARPVGYLGGAHIGPDHGDRLLAAGAEFVAQDWSQVAKRLANNRAVAL